MSQIVRIKYDKNEMRNMVLSKMKSISIINISVICVL